MERKAEQCVITTPRGFVAKRTAGTLWLHNLYLRNVRGTFDAEWAETDMVTVENTRLYMTDVTLEGANDPSATGPQSEDGLVVTAGNVLASGALAGPQRSDAPRPPLLLAARQQGSPGAVAAL